MKLDRKFNRAWEESVKAGRPDSLDSQWRAMRDMAPRHESALLDAAINAADSAHRAAAIFAIGHALEPSASRLAVLLDAAHDPNSTVRNNAVRGLGEWAHRHPEWRTKMPPDIGIGMVRSGTWSDRNKGAFILSELTETRDKGVLGKIRDEAMSSLREMAAWRWSGHNTYARLILGRIAGIEEVRLRKMIDDGDLAGVLQALR